MALVLMRFLQISLLDQTWLHYPIPPPTHPVPVRANQMERRKIAKVIHDLANNRETLIKLILNEAHETVKGLPNCAHKILVVTVHIERKVVLSDDEYEAMAKEKRLEKLSKLVANLLKHARDASWYFILTSVRDAVYANAPKSINNKSFEEKKYEKKVLRWFLNQAIQGLFMPYNGEEMQRKKEVCRICSGDIQQQKEKIGTELDGEEEEVNTCWLPCSHVFHHNCIGPRLKKKPSCPVSHFNLKLEEVLFFAYY